MSYSCKTTCQLEQLKNMYMISWQIDIYELMIMDRANFLNFIRSHESLVMFIGLHRTKLHTFLKGVRRGSQTEIASHYAPVGSYVC